MVIKNFKNKNKMKNFKEIMRCVGVKLINIIYNISSFLKRNINRLTLSKVLVIFVVGLVSRVLVNNFWDVNVFVDYLNSISLVYYGMMSIFIVLVNELFSYIDIKILPKISFDVFRISSIRKSISVLISNQGNKVKVPISGDIGLDKVLDKSNKVKVPGVLLMENRDGISSGVREKGKGVLGVKYLGVKDLGVKEKFSNNGSDISSKSRIVPFVLGNECVDDVFDVNKKEPTSRSNHEYKRRKVTSSGSQYSAKYSIHSEASVDPRIARWEPGAPKISGLSTPETMSPLFPPSEVNSPRPSQTSLTSEQFKEMVKRGKQHIMASSEVNSPRPSYKSFTSEEFRKFVIQGRQKDIIASIETKLKEEDFSKPLRSLSDPIKTSPKNEFSKPNRSYSDPIKTSPRRIISDSLKTSPKKAISKFKDFVDGPGYVEPASPTRVKVERTSAAVKGLYGLEQSEKNTSELKSCKKGVYNKKR